MLVAFSSTVEFSKAFFFCVKFFAKFDVLPKQLLSIIGNHSKSDFSIINWVTGSDEIRQVYSTEILSNTATIREVDLTEIDSVFT